LLKVKALDLSDSLLSGSIPLQISLLTNIETLRLHQNKLRPPLPPNINNLNRLTTLDLSFSNINCPEGQYLDFDNIGRAICKSCFSDWYSLFIFSLKSKINYYFLDIFNNFFLTKRYIFFLYKIGTIYQI
jgi:hypothetical protein